MGISESLREFDGKHIEPLEKLALDLMASGEPQSHLTELFSLANSDDPRLQVAATWVLKRWSQEQVVINAREAKKVIGLLQVVSHWEAKLHLLQTFDVIKIPAGKGNEIKTTLVNNLTDTNKLVRAWSYNGLYQLAEQHPTFRKGVLLLLTEAQRDPAPSVRARVRKICKQSTWTDM